MGGDKKYICSDFDFCNISVILHIRRGLYIIQYGLKKSNKKKAKKSKYKGTVSRTVVYFIALMVVFLHTAPRLYAQKHEADTAASLLKDYPYVIVLDNDTTPELSDSLFYSISRKVIFPVNKYEIPRGSEFRREIENELMPYMNANDHVLYKVMVRGAASPEGPLRWNKFLAEHRAKALIDLIGRNSSIGINENPATDLVAEDYTYLLLLMKENRDRDYATVAEIANRWKGKDPDQKNLKRELQTTDGGKLWRRLLREYYPELRAARIVLMFRKAPQLKPLPAEPLRPAPMDVADNIVSPTAPLRPLDVSFDRLPRRELLSVKSNLLYDFAYMPGYDRFCPIPNVAVEFYPLHGHFTYGASFDGPWWQNYGDHKYFQVRNYQVETRYYFKTGDIDEHGYTGKPAFRGWYLQAYLQAGLYDICFDADRGWIGEGLGGGLGVGYVLPLGKQSRWRLEMGAQFGYFWTKYDPYQWLCPVDPDECSDRYYYKWTGKASDFKKRQYRFHWFGPTRVGITLSYDLLYRKRSGKGISFKRWE